MKRNTHPPVILPDNKEMDLRTSLFTVFLCIIFGANAVAMKISFTGLGVFTTAGIRFLIASLSLYVWAISTGKPLYITRQQFYKIIFLSLLFITQISLFYFGLNRTTASHGTLIGNLLPFFVLILAHFFIPGDSITLRKTIGILLGFIGITLLFYDDPGIKNEVTTGDVMILGAVVIWSINAIFVKRIISSFHPIQITLYPLMMGVPFFFLEGLIWDQEMVRSIDTTIILSLFYQSIITASFGLVAWNSLLRKHGATVLHSFIFIMPISGVFFGVLLLKEPLTPNLIASILFIAIGLSIINSKYLASNQKNWPN